ncbi:MAG: hypothetical protein GEV07_14900 [Streptosporangiales bacterium]|nr:hypothetical protein [Streptosporangiales bacterium]
MAWKKIAGAGVAATVGVGMLIAAVNPANAAGHYPENAFALQVQALGKDVLAAMPYVESPSGDLVKERLVSIPARDNNPTLSLPVSDDAPMDVNVLEAIAEANHAESRVASLNLGGEGGLITADVISAKCEKAAGSTTIADLNIAGDTVAGTVDAPAPNTKIGVPGLLEITLNEQISNDDGSLTVNAVHVEVAPGLTASQVNELVASLDAAGGLSAGAGLTGLGELDLSNVLASEQTEGSLVDVVVASATCGDTPADDGDDDDDDDGDDGGDDGDNGGSAPTPTPVPTNHAVTG